MMQCGDLDKLQYFRSLKELATRLGLELKAIYASIELIELELKKEGLLD
jgi:hypothetical protein